MCVSFRDKAPLSSADRSVNRGEKMEAELLNVLSYLPAPLLLLAHTPILQGDVH